MVVNRAERAFSGSNDFRRAVSPAVAAALSSGAALGSTGTSMPKSAMIWSAVRRRSEDLSGERGLICGRLEHRKKKEKEKKKKKSLAGNKLQWASS